MSATEARNDSRDAAVGQVDMHLEIQVIPVSDVDRAKEFYQRLGNILQEKGYLPSADRYANL